MNDYESLPSKFRATVKWGQSESAGEYIKIILIWRNHGHLDVSENTGDMSWANRLLAC